MQYERDPYVNPLVPCFEDSERPEARWEESKLLRLEGVDTWAVVTVAEGDPF